MQKARDQNESITTEVGKYKDIAEVKSTNATCRVCTPGKFNPLDVGSGYTLPAIGYPSATSKKY
jgi:hypothetical protein